MEVIKRNLCLLIILFMVTTFVHSQEIGISGFLQADLLYQSRPGVSLYYNHSFSDVFTVNFEYGYQYIFNTYKTNNRYVGPHYYSEYVITPKLNLNNFLKKTALHIISFKHHATLQHGTIKSTHK